MTPCDSIKTEESVETQRLGDVIMLKLYKRLKDMNFGKLMDLYAEGNEENARDLYPEEELNAGILRAEADFYQYLRDVFFKTPGAVYAVWENSGEYRSALRLEPYRDGLLLEALETHPSCRRQGYAKKLIFAVQQWITQQGSGPVYSHVHKRNQASLQTHMSCGFERISEQAAYIDGSVNGSSCTMRYQVPSLDKK